MLAVALQICTLWQSAVMTVLAFPYVPDVAGMVDALALDAGQPSAAAIQAAVGVSGTQALQLLPSKVETFVSVWHWANRKTALMCTS